MKQIKVELADNSYEIKIGSGILAHAGVWLKELGFAGKAVIITDSNVKPLYAGTLEKSLAGAGFNVNVFDVPAGEGHKTLQTAGRLYDKLAASYAERSTLIIALGGGVIGDLAGFVSATYMRGVPFIQVPTTLLAMVDSSIGGKTAVDRGKMKNIIGAFYQPKLVVADIDALKTLPQVELSNGMAEAIKMAAVSDSAFFRFLEDMIDKAMSLDSAVLERLVLENAAQKARVVKADEKETGIRVILNYGHTVGHAVEAVSDFTLKHGQAVAIGMIEENKIARRLGLISEIDSGRIMNLVKAAGLPVIMPQLNAEEKTDVLEVVKHDKKVINDKVRFVLLKAIGKPVIRDDVAPELIKEVLFGR